jgi:hypothetical protein
MLYVNLLKREPLPPDPADALAHLRKPLGDLKRRLADSYTQARLAVSYEQLRENGQKWFGDDRWQRHMEAVDQHDLNVDMIIAGFIGRIPVLYQTSRANGYLELEAATNFCVIGSGATTAEPALHARAQSFNTPLPMALYNIYEAKKISEASPFVGKRTILFVVYADENERCVRLEVLTDFGERQLEELYKEYGPKPISSWPNASGEWLRPTLPIRGRTE